VLVESDSDDEIKKGAHHKIEMSSPLALAVSPATSSASTSLPSSNQDSSPESGIPAVVDTGSFANVSFYIDILDFYS
jgi:hypothetical protein